MFRNLLTSALAAAALVAAAAATARGGVYGSVQSPARPFGLDIVDRVQIRNSDRRARQFNSGGLPWMGEVIGQPGGVTQPLGTATATTVMLDPARLPILNDYSARMYFLGEGAGQHNSIGFNARGAGVSAGAQLIFPDATEASGRRRPDSPLRSRDFVDLGLVSGGSVLDFFLIADGANGGTDVFSLDPSANPDGLRHMALHARVDADSPYLLLGFEDALGGGDMDMNELTLALDIGVANVQHLLNTVGAPEPGSLAVLGALLTIGGVAQRRRRPPLRQA